MTEERAAAWPSTWVMCDACKGLGVEQSIDDWGYREDKCVGCHGWGFVWLRDERGRFVSASPTTNDSPQRGAAT